MTSPSKPTLAPSALTPTTEAVIVRSLVAVFAVLVIASAALSSTGLHTLGVRAGVHPVFAWLVPVACDGLIAAGLLAGLYGTLSRTGTLYAWVLVVTGTAMSVAGNVAAAPDNLTARLLHAGAPVVLALSLEAVLGPIRARAGLPVRRTRKASTAPTVVAAAAEPTATTIPNRGPAATSKPVRATPPAPRGNSKTARCRALLTADPTLTVSELVARTAIDPSDARKIRAKMLTEVTA